VRARDVASGTFWFLVGAFVTWSGWDLELGSVHDPGSGFVLFWIGVIMMGLSAAVIVLALRRAAGIEAPAWANVSWARVVGVLIALVAYAWLLERLGFIATTTVVMVFLFKAVEPQRWWVAVTGAVASAVIGYVVFKVWLGAQLPPGVFGLG
jgi:putative tricarboxylic transport membrane protein